MPKPKSSIEARIVEWFREAPVETAEMILGIVQAEIRKRRPPLTRMTPRIRKPRTAQTAKALTNASPQVEAKGDDIPF